MSSPSRVLAVRRPAFDVIWDVSGLRAAEVAEMRALAPILRDTAHVVSVNSAVAGGDAALLADAIVAAARRGHDLLVLVGTALPSPWAVAQMQVDVRADPLWGAAQPRFVDGDSGMVVPLPSDGVELRADGAATVQSLAALPPTLVVPELPAGVNLLRHEVLTTLSLRDADIAGRTVADLFVEVLIRFRRSGFRTVVSNGVVVVLGDPGVPGGTPAEGAYPRSRRDTREELVGRFPDHARAVVPSDIVRYERMLAAAHPLGPRRLLVDCRSLGPRHNGTARSVLGLLDGLRSCGDRWQIELLYSSAGALFHELGRRYPAWPQHADLNGGPYAAVLVPNQPFTVHQQVELHRSSAVTVYNVLDTIAWDVLYAHDGDLALPWRFLGRHADGLAYISEFSRQRFHRRFPVHRSVAEDIIYLGVPVARSVAAAASEGVLVVGNHYDHKGITWAVRVIADAFPHIPITVLGGSDEALPRRVTVIESGLLDEDEAQQRIAAAAVIVFPSLYEGFGLPVVEGLAAHRPVLVRSSELWDELRQFALPNMLHEYRDDIELITSLKNALSGAPSSELAGQTHWSWQDHASGMLELVERCLDRMSFERWQERDDAIACMDLGY